IMLCTTIPPLVQYELFCTKTVTCYPISYFFSYSTRYLRDLHSFPTRRSSDLRVSPRSVTRVAAISVTTSSSVWAPERTPPVHVKIGSTRLNSSHVEISYAVFCLKKKKKM